MKICLFLFLLASLAAGCGTEVTDGKAGSAPVTTIPDTAGNFFPVTTYLRGEIFNIKNIGITPVRRVKTASGFDSSFVAVADYEKVFAAFISPLIDTTNLKNLFTETKFLDQTLNAFTFSYDPIAGKTNDFAFRRWDVYVDAETNKVQRIYLIKNAGPGRELQLTWLSGKRCKIVTLVTAAGTTKIEDEETISWNYDQ